MQSRAGEGGRETSNATRAPREHYIPLRPTELIERLSNEPSVTIFERERFRRLCDIIEATIHHEYRWRLNDLKAAYAPFDPDDDGADGMPQRAFPTAPEAPPRVLPTALFDRFDALLMRANYRRLSREELEQAARNPNHAGLQLALDFDVFERLEVYVRGACLSPRSYRTWRSAWRDRTQFVPTYRRLALIFRLRERSPLTDPLDTRAVVLKLFKDIPRDDVETLLPGVSVRIGWLEQAQIAVPTVAGIGLTLFKLLKGAAAVAFASLYGLLAFLGLVSGAVGYGMKSFYGYLRAREKYQLSLTRHLYFQNLDNNAGVLYHLLAEAEEQELREIVLAWWLLWRGGLAGATARQIDAAAEEWLRERRGIEADFEIADALAKLQRLGLATSTATGRWRAVTIKQALATLDRKWDGQFRYQQPQIAPQPRIWRRAA